MGPVGRGHGGVWSCAREDALLGVGRDSGRGGWGGPEPCDVAGACLPGAGSVSSGATGPPLCWRPWAVGPRVPRRPTSGLGRRLGGALALPRGGPRSPSPRGCSGFWRPSPPPPSRRLAASPRPPADPGAARPGALALLRPVAASHPCLPPPPARRRCRGCGRGTVPPAPTPCALPSLRRACPGVGRVPAVRRGRGGRARCLPRWWWGGRAPARLPSPRGSACRPVPAPAWPTGAPARPPVPRAALGGPPRCVGGGRSVPPSPLRGAAAGVPSSAVGGARPVQPRSPVAGGGGPWRVGKRLPAP